MAVLIAARSRTAVSAREGKVLCRSISVVVSVGVA